MSERAADSARERPAGEVAREDDEAAISFERPWVGFGKQIY